MKIEKVKFKASFVDRNGLTRVVDLKHFSNRRKEINFFVDDDVNDGGDREARL